VVSRPNCGSSAIVTDDDEADIIVSSVRVTDVDDEGLRRGAGLAREGDSLCEGLLGHASKGDDMVGAVEPVLANDMSAAAALRQPYRWQAKFYSPR
jgi:hypothetical protein